MKNRNTISEMNETKIASQDFLRKSSSKFCLYVTSMETSTKCYMYFSYSLHNLAWICYTSVCIYSEICTI